MNGRFLAAGVVMIGMLLTATVLSWGDDWTPQNWSITPTTSLGKVRFTIRGSDGFSHWSSGWRVPIERLRGFSIGMLAGGGPAKFEYATDAATLVCEGRFAFGRGSGTFTLVPNPAFMGDLERMGYGTPDQDQLLTMLLTGIDRAYAQEVHDVDVRASVRDLIGLRSSGVTLDYIRKTKRLGYKFTADEIMRLQNHGVN